MLRNYILDAEGVDMYTQDRFRHKWYIRSRDAVTAKQSLEAIGKRLQIHYIIHSVNLNQVIPRKIKNAR